MQYQAILFDFDYTLGDSTVPITIGYQTGLTAMGWPEPTVEQVKPTIGYTLYDGYAMLTGDHDRAHQEEFYRRFQEAVGEKAIAAGNETMVRETRFCSGALELLRALKEAGVPAGIVSTKLGSTIRQIFAHHQAEELLVLVVGGEDVTKPKPDPQGLLGALEQLGVKPEHALFCGDTVIDAKTAQAAGTDFCAVLNGTTPASAFDEYSHVHIAPNLTDLKDWLGV